MFTISHAEAQSPQKPQAAAHANVARGASMILLEQVRIQRQLIDMGDPLAHRIRQRAGKNSAAIASLFFGTSGGTSAELHVNEQGYVEGAYHTADGRTPLLMRLPTSDAPYNPSLTHAAMYADGMHYEAYPISNPGSLGLFRSVVETLALLV